MRDKLKLPLTEAQAKEAMHLSLAASLSTESDSERFSIRRPDEASFEISISPLTVIELEQTLALANGILDEEQ